MSTFWFGKVRFQIDMDHFNFNLTHDIPQTCGLPVSSKIQQNSLVKVEVNNRVTE